MSYRGNPIVFSTSFLITPARGLHTFHPETPLSQSVRDESDQFCDQTPYLQPSHTCFSTVQVNNVVENYHQTGTEDKGCDESEPANLLCFVPHAETTALFREQSSDREMFVSQIVLLPGKNRITESNLWCPLTFFFYKFLFPYWQTHHVFAYI